MKRAKRLYALLGVLAVVCIATVAVLHVEEKKEQISAAGEIVLSVSPDEVQTLQWEYGGNTLSFHKDGSWLYDADEAFPVDGKKLEEMLDIFSAFGVSFIIEDVEDFALYGLDEPECTITFATEDEAYTVELGDYSKMDEERYVSIGDGRVYLAKVDPLDEFDAELDDVILHDKSLSYDEVTRITFEGTENYSIYREESSTNAYCEDDLYYTERDGVTVPLDTSRVGSYLEALTTLHLTDYVTYNVTDEELESCDLVEPELTVTVEYTDTDGAVQTYTLSVSRDSEELASAEKAEADGEEAEDVTAYVRVGESQLVYRVSAYTGSELLAASYDELRHREVLVADLEDMTQLDVTLDSKRYTLLADGEDDERVWLYDGEEIELDTLQKKLQALKVEYSSDFTAESPTGKREISLTVHLADETRPTVEIVLYRYDGTHCLAVVDGETLALVPRDDTVALIEAVNAIVLR